MTISAVLAELKKRLKALKIIDDLLPEQKAVHDAVSKYVAIRCSRRAGKSWTILAIMAAKCISEPHARCLYLALTFDNVRNIVMTTIQQINDKYSLGLKINKANLTITFPNGSTIECKGADTSVLDTDKFAGTYYDIVAIDEAASFNPDTLNYLIDDVLEQTLIDKDGVLILAGSPRPVESGRFFEIATNFGRNRELWQGKVAQYEVFSWDTTCNKFVVENWQKKIDEKIAENPEIANTAAFLRNYRGYWATDIGERVYKITIKNHIDEVPQYIDPYFVCGIDFGWKDDMAFVQCLVNRYDNTFYILESYKCPEMSIDDIVEKLKYYQQKYPRTLFYADTNEKIVCNEIANRFHITINNADKTNKNGEDGWIEIFNNDALRGKVKVVKDMNAALLTDVNKLTWMLKKNGERIEDPNVPNHLQDAMLYAYRACYHYLEFPEKVMTIEEQMFEQTRLKVIEANRDWRLK